jgi:hypothetical protein
MSEVLLPLGFADLEPFATTWCLVTGEERWDRRMASEMDELQAFYDVANPRLADALAYCDTFPIDDLPDDARHLLELVHSTILVAMCVEIWHQPKVIDSGSAELMRVSEPMP